MLKPGESEILTMNFTDYDLAHFDEPSSSWVLEKGLYKVSFGASCEDIRSVRDIKVKKQFIYVRIVVTVITRTNVLKGIILKYH